MSSSFVALGSRSSLLPIGSFAIEKMRESTTPNHRQYSLVDRIELNRALSEAGQQPLFQAARINLGTNPTHQDTLTIGDDVYEFINTGTGTVVADDANVAVVIGGSAATTFTNLLAAINGTAAAAHATVTKADTETPAVGVGTHKVFAFNFGSSVLGVVNSTAQGVDPMDFAWSSYTSMPDNLPSIALSDALTASVAWSNTNMNQLAWFNPVYDTRGSVSFRLAITTAMINAGVVRVFCPGILKSDSPVVHVTGYTSAGVLKTAGTDTFIWDTTNGCLNITLGGGFSNTDVLHVTLFGQTSAVL